MELEDYNAPLISVELTYALSHVNSAAPGPDDIYYEMLCKLPPTGQAVVPLHSFIHLLWQVSGLRPCNALKKTCVTGVNSKEAVVDYFDSQMTQENIPTPESFFIFRRKKPTADDAFCKLSDEMVLTIFRHMPKKSLVRCAFVCKRWRRIAYDESLWSRLDLSLRTLRPGNLGYTLVRGVSILRLAQAEVSDPVFECASPLVTKEYDCKLQYLDLSMAVISKRGKVKFALSLEYDGRPAIALVCALRL
uniref:F-box domain-containing protein n=1 Tax=Timema douglasi TaxID=61478 RepID=A0A7R8VQ17_TIMDO|nr:unnamed protein product [Timema douglasi]